MNKALKPLFVGSSDSIKLKELGYPQYPNFGYCYDPNCLEDDHPYDWYEERGCSTPERMQRMATAPTYDQVIRWAADHGLHIGYNYIPTEEFAHPDNTEKTQHRFEIRVEGTTEYNLNVHANSYPQGIFIVTKILIFTLETIKSKSDGK